MDRLPNEDGISVTVSSRFQFVAAFCGGLFNASLVDSLAFIGAFSNAVGPLT
jgi:hypothetical protein